MAKNDFYSQGSRNQFKNRGEDLTISHVPTGQTVVFPAFLDLFSDSFSSQWNAEDVYGRMDPIATFMNTRRAISVAWHVPADSFEHAEENVAKVNKLMSFLYPLYDKKRNGGASVINQGPLMRVSFGNLIRNAKTGRGLLGFMNGFTFDPALEFGMFNRRGVLVSDPRLKDKDGKQKFNPQWNEYYPKTFRLNFELVVLHEHELGFAKRGKGSYSFNSDLAQVSNASFPYLTERTDEGTERAAEQRLKGKDPTGFYTKADPNSPFNLNPLGVLGKKD